MNAINYAARVDTYNYALETFGLQTQLTVALEELSEAQKEICKVLRGAGDMDHLAEEVADATIVLEQVRQIFDINEAVCNHMDRKVVRLLARTKKAREEKNQCTTAKKAHGRYCPE